MQAVQVVQAIHWLWSLHCQFVFVPRLRWREIFTDRCACHALRIGDSLGISADSRAIYVRAVPPGQHSTVFTRKDSKTDSNSASVIRLMFQNVPRSYCNCLGRIGSGFAMDALEIRGLLL